LPKVELIWNVVSGGEPQDLATVEAAVNDYLASRINATVKFVHADWGSYNDKINLVHNSGEANDIEFTAPWTNNYGAGVANGVFVDLSESLPQYAPDLYASMAPTTWNAAKISGKLYGVINQQRFPKLMGISVRKDLADKYGLDLEAIKSYSDQALFDFMQKVKDGGDVKYVTVTPWVDPTPFMYDTLGVAVVKVDDASGKAVNFYDTPEFAEYMHNIRKWAEAGFLPADPIPDEDAAIKAGEVGMLVLRNAVGPGADITLKNKYGMEFVTKQMHEAFLNTDGCVATLNAVSVASKNPDRALMLLNLVNTDPVLYNLICYGVEDKHWKWVDKDKKLIEKIADSGYDPNTNWEFGNTFNAYYSDPALVGMADLDKEINDNAKPSPVLGFAFDRKPVETILAGMGAVVDPLNALLYAGLEPDVDAAIANIKAAASAAGQDEVLAEVNKQIEAWKKSL
jgi:putative aldouronate transport system substrate-binding protein